MHLSFDFHLKHACLPCKVDTVISLKPARASMTQSHGRDEKDSDESSILSSSSPMVDSTKIPKLPTSN